MDRTDLPLLTANDIDVLIDCVHERFMAVSSGRERPDFERVILLNTLSNLHARLQLARETLTGPDTYVVCTEHSATNCIARGKPDENEGRRSRLHEALSREGRRPGRT